MLNRAHDSSRAPTHRMRESDQHAVGPAGTLLKTCNTCFHGKIRCDRSKDSGPCDRCLRLGKECVFPPRRQNHKAQVRHNRTLENQASAHTAQDVPASGDVQAPGALNLQDSSQSRTPNDEPLAQIRTWLDAQGEERLFDLYRTRLSPRFPIVIVPENVKPQDMQQERPCTHLAILAVSSSSDFVLQHRLSSLFNRVLAARLETGKLISLDVLQALLLQLAWAHYQPRPRSYTQQLLLATSIVTDLRLERPRKQQFWTVPGDTAEGASPEWPSDELRAMIGTYYLASCTSIILQKMHTFPYTSSILESCQTLAQRGEYPSDRYLYHIVQHQHLSEELEAAVRNVTPSTEAIITSIRYRLDSFKAELSFPLNDCPILVLQLNVLELLISQQSLPHVPLGTIQQSVIDNPQPVMDALLECIMASKAVLSAFLAVPAGYEHFLMNLEWVLLSWSLSFSARVDVLASSPYMAHLTERPRRRLDFPHTLRQVLLRLESLVSPREDSTGDRDVFFHFLKRIRGIEAWYLRHTGLESLSTPGSVDAPTSTAGQASSRATAADLALAAKPYPFAPGYGNISTTDFFPQGMQDVDFGMFLGMQDFDLF